MIVETQKGPVKLAANLKWLFTDLPFLDRFDAAAAAGFTGVEYSSPYEFVPVELHKRLDSTGLAQILINTPAGTAGSPTQNGAAAVPGAEAEFRDGVKRALEYATTLGAGLIHLMAGLRPQGVSASDSMSLYVDNVAWAAEQASPTGVRLVLEAINKRDVPRFALDSFEDAAEVAQSVDPKTIAVLFDVYHAQVDRGNLIERFNALLPSIGHVQVADNPGRGEPGTGEIAYANVLANVAASGYDGWVGCEYRPVTNTIAGLRWIDDLTPGTVGKDWRDQ
ncbi:TIM barrel protein [Diaminobutyricibacter tongyongensis]|uniref:TIM barrel protein n=1 Tax=Leifsonia tongyongensis TaxID=1268043 RepID=A0A6L9Y2N8_9MICO|nr:TIM barrel protein [Diaminobutyricibacter tongyongensis]NEN07677.1 TIM barrel protein [Diaminobutyricibacter tongyongensis]